MPNIVQNIFKMKWHSQSNDPLSNA